MNFCEVDIEDYNPRNCGIDYAGIVGIGLININESPTEGNLEDPDFWLALTNTLSPKYFVIRNTRGEYNGGEVEEEEDLEGTRVVDAKHTAIIESTGIAENWEYWNYILKNYWKICLITSGGLLYYIDKPTSIYTKVNNSKNIKGQAFFQSEMKWSDFSNPVILNAPDGIFYGLESVLLGGSGFDYTFDFTL